VTVAAGMTKAQRLMQQSRAELTGHSSLSPSHFLSFSLLRKNLDWKQKKKVRKKKKRATAWLKSLEGIFLLVLRVHKTEQNRIKQRAGNESNSLCGSSSLSSQLCRDALAARVLFSNTPAHIRIHTKSVVIGLLNSRKD
jgi:hypothetical protein